MVEPRLAPSRRQPLFSDALEARVCMPFLLNTRVAGSEHLCH